MSVPTVPCKWCSKPTHMIGTRECDPCHAVRVQVQHSPRLALRVMLEQGDALRWQEFREEDGAGSRLMMGAMPIASIQMGADLNTYHLFFFDRHKRIAAAAPEAAKYKVEEELGLSAKPA